MNAIVARVIVVAAVLGFSGIPVTPAVGTPLVEGFPDATLTVYPMTYAVTGPKEAYRDFYDRLMGAPGQKYFAVIGLLKDLLAERGYDSCHTTDASFHFAEGPGGRDDRAAAFGAFVSEQAIDTDYALCVDAICHLEQSWQEVYAVMVDAKGHVVWQDASRRGDTAFDRHMTGGPEKACVLVCEMLIPIIGLNELTAEALSPEAEEALGQMRVEAPPSREESQAMELRLADMKEAGETATVTVYPPRVQGERTDAASAARIAEDLNEVELLTATAAAEGALLEGDGWPDESKVLWLYANAAKDHLRRHTAASDYALFADYWMAPTGEVWAVHFVVLDRRGDWVIVDLQNNHHADFQRIAPATAEDCDQLVVARMSAMLR